MPNSRDLADNGQKLFDVQVEIGKIVAERPDGWKSTMIQLRRALAAHFSTLQAQIDMMDDEVDKASPQGDFKASFLALRKAVTSHQADWPSVSADFAHAAYRTSVETVITSTERFEKSIQALRRT